MKPTYLRQMNMCTIGDLKSLEPHFAQMAEKGWMIEKIGLFTHSFIAVPPCKKRFFVDILPQITMFDYPDNMQAQDYRRLCEESGWSFVTASKQFHVFCAEENAPDPVPIHTDNKIQAQIYLKASRKSELLAMGYALFTIVFLTLMQLLTSGIEIFLSDLATFQMIGNVFFLAGYTWVVGFILSWHNKTKKSAELDLPMPKVDYRLSRIRGKVLVVCIVLYLLCLLTGVILESFGGMPLGFLSILIIPVVAFLVGLWLRRRIDTRNRDRKTNKRMFILTMVVLEIVFLSLVGFVVWKTLSTGRDEETLDDRPAITLRNIGITDVKNSNTRIDGSVAVPIHYTYWEWGGDGSVETEVYRSVSKTLSRALYQNLVRDFEKSLHNREAYTGDGIDLSSSDAAVWGAEEGVAMNTASGNTIELVLLRDKTILRLTLSGEEMNEDTATQAVSALWERLH